MLLRAAGRKLIIKRKEDTSRKTYPDIGKEIEKYVEEHSVGADAWKHTGVFMVIANLSMKR